MLLIMFWFKTMLLPREPCASISVETLISIDAYQWPKSNSCWNNM